MKKEKTTEILIDPALLYLESLLQTLDTSFFDDDIKNQIQKLKKLVNNKIYTNSTFCRNVIKTEYKAVFYYEK